MVYPAWIDCLVVKSLRGKGKDRERERERQLFLLGIWMFVKTNRGGFLACTKPVHDLKGV